MSITTNAAIEFFGTATDLSNSVAAVTDGAFSNGTTDLDAFTNDDDANYAAAVLRCQYATGTVGSAPYVNLYGRLMNVDGTDDEAVPDASYQEKPFGTFHIDPNWGTGTDTVKSIEIPLPNVYTSQVYNFYVENQTGVDFATGWALTVTPKALGPHA